MERIRLYGLGEFVASGDGKLMVIDEKFKNLNQKEEMFLSYFHQLFQGSPPLFTSGRNKRDAVFLLERVWDGYCGSLDKSFTISYRRKDEQWLRSVCIYFKFKGPILGSMHDANVSLSGYTNGTVSKVDEYVRSRIIGDLTSKPGVDWNSFICSEYSLKLLQEWFVEFCKNFEL